MVTFPMNNATVNFPRSFMKPNEASFLNIPQLCVAIIRHGLEQGAVVQKFKEPPLVPRSRKADSRGKPGAQLPGARARPAPRPSAIRASHMKTREPDGQPGNCATF